MTFAVVQPTDIGPALLPWRCTPPCTTHDVGHQRHRGLSDSTLLLLNTVHCPASISVHTDGVGADFCGSLVTFTRLVRDAPIIGSPPNTKDSAAPAFIFGYSPG